MWTHSIGYVSIYACKPIYAYIDTQFIFTVCICIHIHIHMIERERCTYIRTPDIYILYIIYIYMYKRDAPHDLHIVVATYPHSFSHSARSYLCRRLDGFASLLCSTSAKDEDCPAKSGDAGTVTRRWSPNLIFGLISASKNWMSLCMYGCGSKMLKVT